MRTLLQGVKMKVKQIIDEDFVNYKKPSMYIAFPKCDLKCNRDCGKAVCHNTPILNEPNVEISYSKIVKRYLTNDITSAVVFCGMEPFDTPHDLFLLIEEFRKYTQDDIVIYTGYYYSEISTYVAMLYDYKNIIIKFGRYIPNQTPHYDEVLGVNLASDNQYAERFN